jgi:hypothetical protein
MEALANKIAARYGLCAISAGDVNSMEWVICEPNAPSRGSFTVRIPFHIRLFLQRSDFHLGVRLVRRRDGDVLWKEHSGQEILDNVLPEIERLTGLAVQPLGVIEDLVKSEMVS